MWRISPTTIGLATRVLTEKSYFVFPLCYRSVIRAGIRYRATSTKIRIVAGLLNISPKDIEFHNQVVNVVKAKRGKQRRVMLDQGMLELLSEYI